MLRREDLEELRSRLLDKHREDMAALDRIIRLLSASSDEVAPTPVNIDAHKPDLPEVETENSGGLKSTVERIMREAPDRDWSTVSLLAHMSSMGIQPNTKRPDASIGQVLRALISETKIILSKQGSGRAPHLFRWLDRTGELFVEQNVA